MPAAPAFAEGSVDFNQGEDTRFRNGMTAEPGAAGRYTVLRVYARAGERIQMAHSAMGINAPFGNGLDNILVYPPGTDFASSTDPSLPAALPSDPVFATDIVDCNADQPGTGRIASRAQELAGPAPNPGGYVPCEFTAPADGIYPILMTPHLAGPGGTAGAVAGRPLALATAGRACEPFGLADAPSLTVGFRPVAGLPDRGHAEHPPQRRIPTGAIPADRISARRQFKHAGPRSRKRSSKSRARQVGTSPRWV